MHTTPSAPGESAAMDFHCRRKYITNRVSSGTFFGKKSSSEKFGSKLGFFDSGTTASYNKSGNEISAKEMSPMCDSNFLGSLLESPGDLKADCCSSGKKKVNMGSGLRSDGEGDEGLGKGGTARRRKDYGRKNCVTDGNPGRRLLMGNVTILKRGEKIEDVVASRSSDEEERGGLKGKGASKKISGRGVFVREEKKAVERCSSSGRGFPAKRPVKKGKAVARVSQVCPVVSFSEMDSKDVEIDKSGEREKDEILSRLGPEPSVLLKVVGSGNLRRVSLGNRVSDASSDDDVPGRSETKERCSGSDGNVKSPSTSLAIPRVKTPDNLACRTPEPVQYSNGGLMFEKWAGPAYANSPSPRCLPLPKFFIRHKVRPSTPEEAIDIKRSEIPESSVLVNDIHAALPVEKNNVSMFSHGGFDAFATRNLRRLLQLE